MNSVEDTTADGRARANAGCSQLLVGRKSKEVAQANGKLIDIQITILKAVQHRL